MLLFIMHLPGRCSRKELADLISSSRSRVWYLLPFVRRPSLAMCKILRVEDRENDTVEYHGVVSVHPKKFSHFVMAKLNGRILHGRPLKVRQYIKRSHYKDRRRHYMDLELLQNERRKKDRRRASLRIRTLNCRRIEYG